MQVNFRNIADTIKPAELVKQARNGMAWLLIADTTYRGEETFTAVFAVEYKQSQGRHRESVWEEYIGGGMKTFETRQAAIDYIAQK